MKMNILKVNTLKGGFKSVLGEVRTNQFDGRNVIVVPDKFSLNAERLVMEELGLTSTLNIEITTLARLADTYSKKVQLPTLSKNAGIMVIQSVVLGMNDLQCFGGAKGFTGFCENVFNTIMQLKSCNITPDKLRKGIDELSNLSAKKIQDLVQIYENYENFCHERFLDSANKLDILASEAENDYSLSDTFFYFCMSESWTEQAMNAVQNLTRSAKEVYFALVDFDANLPLKTRSQINVLTNNLNLKPNIINTQDIINSEFDAINSLLVNGFKSQKTKNTVCDFFNANDVREEIERVAKKINIAVREGERFKNFGVACANLLELQPLIMDVFAEYKIPCFFDCEKPITEMPLILFLNKIFEMLLNFNKQTIFSVMHDRFFAVEFNDLCKFENFVLKLGFDRQQFLKRFVLCNAESFSQDDLNLYENLRIQIKDFFQMLLYNFTNDIKINDFCDNLRKLIQNYKLEDANSLLSKELEANGQVYESAMNEQVLDKLNNLLSEMEMIFGGVNMPLQDVLKIFKSGLDSISLSNAPLKLDNVFVGDSNNSILVETQNLFFINCVEGVFPKILNDCGLISDAEIDNINWAKIEPSIRQINFVNKFNVTQNIFMGYKKVEFSYSNNNQLKQLQIGSNFLNNILNLFCDADGNQCKFNACFAPELVVGNYNLSQFLGLMGSEINACRYVLNALWHETKNIGNQKKIAILYDFFEKNSDFSLKNENKMELLNNLLPLSIKSRTSISQMGSYFECPFKHYASYALQLREKELADIESVDIGKFLHAVAEKLGNKIKENGKENAEIYIAEIIKEVSNDADFRYKLDRLSKSLKTGLMKEADRMCQAIIYQLKNSEFNIDEVEYNIFYAIGTENPLQVYGEVDRLDCYKDYFRIIDYKTGSKYNMDLDEIYFGNRLQMFIYSNAIAKMKNKIKCGLYYMHVKDKYSMDANEEYKDYKLKGLTLDDVDLVLAQDSNLCLNSPKSALLDISISKTKSKPNGELVFNGVGKTVLSSKELSLLSNYCEKLMLQVREELGQGYIQCSPRDKKVCEFCKFHTLCEFDQMRGNYYRDIKINVQCIPILKDNAKKEVVENEC